MNSGWLVVWLLALSLVSCGATTRSSEASAGAGGSASSAGAGAGGSAGLASACDCSLDSDGDGLADVAENPYCSSLSNYQPDQDYDRIPDYLDSDSDGDGIPDADEAGDHAACGGGRDTDGDGLPDFLDIDSDEDQISDAYELLNGTDPRLTDSDGDGCDDWVELTFGECIPGSQVVLETTCYSDATSTELTLVAQTEFDGRLSDLTTTLAPPSPDTNPVSATPVAVSPPAAGTIDNGALTSIAFGATVTFSISASAWNLGPTVYTLTIESASQGLLARGQVLIRLEECPIPK